MAPERPFVTSLAEADVAETDEKRRPIVMNPPAGPLASLWELAQLEFEAQGKSAATKDDWNAITERYHALITERRGDLGSIIREVARPDMPEPIGLNLPTQILRATLTPFGEAVAAKLIPEEIAMRVIAPSDAIGTMRRLLARLGLEGKKQLSGRGTTGPTWAEDPAFFIRRWVSPESLIILKEDANGPVGLEFDTRLSQDTFKVVYRIGDAGGHAVLLRAFYDIGIRRSVWEFHVDRTPKGYVERVNERYAAIRGCDLAIVPRDSEWVDYILTLTARP